jgi:imidazolonepropionase-like amidohydrolase
LSPRDLASNHAPQVRYRQAVYITSADAEGREVSTQAAESIKRNGVVFVPTLITYFAMSADEKILDLRDDEKAKLEELLKLLGISEVQKRKLNQLALAALGGLETLKRHGVTIGFGTDLIGGYVDTGTGEVRSFMDLQSKEFSIRRKLNSDVEILRQATSISAKVLAMTGPGVGLKGREVGVVRADALADLLLVDGDPTMDVRVLEDTSNLVLIMKDGKIFKNEASR